MLVSSNHTLVGVQIVCLMAQPIIFTYEILLKDLLRTVPTQVKEVAKFLSLVIVFGTNGTNG